MHNKYHHGDLKQELIYNGLVLLNEKGVDNFSLRKVASMCGVSHNAPYKHFKDKHQLINEILKEVWGKFNSALIEVVYKYSDDYKKQVVEMGKTYVKFMVENPEYLKLMFLSKTISPIKIENEKFYQDKDTAFKVFERCAYNYFDQINLNKNLYMQKTLAMWSMVHGISILIVKKSILYSGDYLKLVEEMLENSIIITS